jgi:hypothetical protein
MVDDVPQGDEIERTVWKIRILKSPTDDTGETQGVPSIPDGGRRDLTAICLPVRIGCHAFQKESESASHVEESP